MIAPDIRLRSEELLFLNQASESHPKLKKLFASISFEIASRNLRRVQNRIALWAFHLTGTIPGEDYFQDLLNFDDKTGTEQIVLKRNQLPKSQVHIVSNEVIRSRIKDAINDFDEVIGRKFDINPQASRHRYIAPIRSNISMETHPLSGYFAGLILVDVDSDHTELIRRMIFELFRGLLYSRAGMGRIPAGSGSSADFCFSVFSRQILPTEIFLCEWLANAFFLELCTDKKNKYREVLCRDMGANEAKRFIEKLRQLCFLSARVVSTELIDKSLLNLVKTLIDADTWFKPQKSLGASDVSTSKNVYMRKLSLSDQADVLLAEEGFKVSRIYVKKSIARDLISSFNDKIFHYCGESYLRKNSKLCPDDLGNMPWKEIRFDKPSNSSDSISLFIGRDRIATKQAAKKDQLNDSGNIYGYPECCEQFFKKSWERSLEESDGDLFAYMLKNESTFHRAIVIDKHVNAALAYFNLGFGTHFPCSSRCESTIRLNRRRSELIQNKRPELFNKLNPPEFVKTIYHQKYGWGLLSMFSQMHIRCEWVDGKTRNNIDYHDCFFSHEPSEPVIRLEHVS